MDGMAWRVGKDALCHRYTTIDILQEGMIEKGIRSFLPNLILLTKKIHNSHSSDVSRRLNSDDESTVNVTVDSPNVTPPRTDDPPDLASVMQLFQVNNKLDLINYFGTKMSAIRVNPI